MSSSIIKLVGIPKTSKLKYIKTFGASMEPLLQDGDVVFIVRKSFSNIKVNDIVCVSKNNRIFTHRVIYRNASHLITRGDNNNSHDGKIYPKNLIGIVNKIKRNGQIFNVQTLYLLQSSIYFQEIVKIKKSFEKEGIGFLFLKGLPYYLYYEGRPPARIYSDCDVLIRREHATKAGKILNKIGFIKEKSSETHARLLRGKKTTFTKLLNGFPVVIDVHFEVVFIVSRVGNTSLFYSQNLINELTNKILLEKTEIVSWGERFPVLTIENLIVYRFLHLFHHNFKGAYRYDFLNLVLNKHVADNGKIVDLISEFSLQNFIGPCLILLIKYYKSKTAGEILRKIKREKNYFIPHKIDIFSKDDSPGTGKYFRILFQISPSPLWKKMLFFIDPKVINIALRVLWENSKAI